MIVIRLLPAKQFMLLPALFLLQANWIYGQDNQIWNEYMLNRPFSQSWNIEFAGTYSTVITGPKWRSLDAQVTPEYALSKYVDLMGALFIGYTLQNQSLSTFELREMLGTRIHLTPDKKILTRFLVRLENRNLQNIETGQWSSSNRSRLRVETITPLNMPTMYSGDKLWYMIFDAEAFIVLDQDVQERFANRLRLRYGFGYRFNYLTRLEFVYTLQQSKDALTEDFYTTDNIFRFRIKQYLRSGKSSKAEGVGN